MTRRLFTLAALLSLALCLATAVLWVDSYWTGRWLYYTHERWATVDGRRSVDATNYGLLLQRGVVQAGRWLHGQIHYNTVNGDHFYHHHWRQWDWGRIDITKWDAQYQLSYWNIGVVRPQRTFGPFGMGTYSAPFTGMAMDGPADSVRSAVFFPVWPLFVLTFLPAIPLMRRFAWVVHGRWKARRLGRCENCGYDLRATPGRCPECGAVPAEAKP